MGTPLVVARMAVCNIGHGVTAPGQSAPATESIVLQAAPPIATAEVPNGTLQMTLTDPAMMKKLELGKSYRVIVLADDDA